MESLHFVKLTYRIPDSYYANIGSGRASLQLTLGSNCVTVWLCIVCTDNRNWLIVTIVSTHMHGFQRQRQFLINYIIIASPDHISDSFFLHFFEILDLFGCNQNKDCCRNVGNLVKSLIFPSWGLMCNSSFPATFCFCEQHLINTDVHYSVNHLAFKRWGELVAVESAWTEKTKTNKSSAPLFCKYKHRASVTWSVRYMLKIKGNY